MEKKVCRKKKRIEYEYIQWSGKPEDIDTVLRWGFPKLEYIGKGLIQLKENERYLLPSDITHVARASYYLVKEEMMKRIVIFTPAEFENLYEIIS